MGDQNEKVLLVAFDGMDKDLIQKFELSHLYSNSKEFGSINNTAGVNQIKTVELFSVMITGEEIRNLNRKGMNKINYPKRKRFIDFIFPDRLKQNVRGAFRAYKTLKTGLNIKKEPYLKRDFEKNTIFDKIHNSRSMFVPGNNPSKLWATGGHRKVMESESFNKEDAIDIWRTREHRHRKESLFSELENEIVSPRDFLMCHFHLPDFFQHLKGDRELGNYDEEFLRKLYRELDDLAGEIEEKALENGYDTVIFMSDHGLPTTSAHNENAFYSCNKEIFPNKTPKIADFHDKILELIEE